MILHSELKRQRNLVKKLKKKSLWSRPLEDVIIFVHIFFFTLYLGLFYYGLCLVVLYWYIYLVMNVLLAYCFFFRLKDANIDLRYPLSRLWKSLLTSPFFWIDKSGMHLMKLVSKLLIGFIIVRTKCVWQYSDTSVNKQFL
jgi:hypothetical protein